jgi:hypothetical protein
MLLKLREATPLRPLRGSHRGVYVLLKDPQLLLGLQDFLRRTGCVAEQRRSDQLEVYVPDAPNQEQERREVSVYLASWQAANPGAEVSIVDALAATKSAFTLGARARLALTRRRSGRQ